MADKAGRTTMDREIVRSLLDTKAVDFEAIGAAVAKYGPTLALEGDGEEGFCGTMRWFVRLFHLPGTVGGIGDLGELRGVIGTELRE